MYEMKCMNYGGFKKVFILSGWIYEGEEWGGAVIAVCIAASLMWISLNMNCWSSRTQAPLVIVDTSDRQLSYLLMNLDFLFMFAPQIKGQSEEQSDRKSKQNELSVLSARVLRRIKTFKWKRRLRSCVSLSSRVQRFAIFPVRCRRT